MQGLLIRSAAVAVSIACLAAAPADLFDTPLDKTVVALPPDPLNPHMKPKRSCTRYPGFLVKEIDLGEIGAEEQTILPLPIGAKTPACEAKLKHEIVIKPAVWSGTFDGAKGGFLFYDAGDGVNGGMPFAVFAARTGRKLFEDSRAGDRFASVALENGALIVRYRRVWLAPCSLYADAARCWKKIIDRTALAPSARPDCSAKYRDTIKAWPRSVETTVHLPTVIAYEAEARFDHGRLAVTPRPGKTSCWMED